MDLAQFAQRWQPKPPQKAPANEDEIRRLGPADGVEYLERPPAIGRVRSTPSDPSGRHLWVFLPEQVPYVLETAPQVTPPLRTGMAKHTNLTGGSPACCAGELWIDPAGAETLYINGWSGRYRVRSKEQLTDVVAVLSARGFDVRSFGWSDDNDQPARVYRP